MKKLALILSLCVVVGGIATGCSKTNTDKVTVGKDTIGTEVTGDVVESAGDIAGTVADSTGVAEASNFDYSHIFDANGYIKGLKAADIVTDLFDYSKFPIPKDIHMVPDEVIQEQIQAICNYYGLNAKITDRVIKEGDLVNIDYVGSVDGVEFDGGGTYNEGTVVTAGSNEYIEDFLTQIIGHKPGDTLDISVTFPEDYGVEGLDGKDAKFVTTINYIVGEGILTDEDVVANLSFSNGWTTVKEAEEGIRANLQEVQIQNHIVNYVADYAQTAVDKAQLPQDYVDYYDKVTVAYFQDSANQANMSYSDYLLTFLQVEDTPALLELLKEDNERETLNAIVIQAIAEKANLTISEAEIQEFAETISNGLDAASLTEYEKQYGLPYLKHIILQQKVTNFIYDNAVMN